MKNIITNCMVGLMLATTLPGTAIATDAPVTTDKTIRSSQDGGSFGGKKAQNKRNRRTKKMNRKGGVGYQFSVVSDQLAAVEGREVSNA